MHMERVRDQLLYKDHVNDKDLLNVLAFYKDQRLFDNVLHNINKSVVVLTIGCANVHPGSNESTNQMGYDQKYGKLINKIVNPDNRRMVDDHELVFDEMKGARQNESNMESMMNRFKQMQD